LAKAARFLEERASKREREAALRPISVHVCAADGSPACIRIEYRDSESAVEADRRIMAAAAREWIFWETQHCPYDPEWRFGGGTLLTGETDADILRGSYPWDDEAEFDLTALSGPVNGRQSVDTWPLTGLRAIIENAEGAPVLLVREGDSQASRYYCSSSRKGDFLAKLSSSPAEFKVDESPFRSRELDMLWSWVEDWERRV
jgi:hypothetical protein